MRKLVLFMCFLCHLTLISCNVPDYSSELVFSFTMQRHGDRTPSEKKMKYSTNPDELEKLVEPYGYKQLTEKGMYNCYTIGKYIRETYNDFLGPKYKESRVYLRAADGTRTKMSMLTTLAGIYPPATKWNEDINWTPVPYETAPQKYDFNSANDNCPVLTNAIAKIKEKSHHKMHKYREVLDLITKETHAGFDVAKKPLFIIDIYNVLADQISLGLPLPAALQEKWDQVTAAAIEAYKIMYHNSNLSPYVTGVLLHYFFKYADLAISAKPTPLLRIYTAHQENVFTFTRITNTDINIYPTFASAFTLDLRRESSGKIFVEPVFAHLTSNGSVSYGVYTIKDCGHRCYYDEFVKLTKKHAWHYKTWRSKCGASNEANITSTWRK